MCHCHIQLQRVLSECRFFFYLHFLLEVSSAHSCHLHKVHIDGGEGMWKERERTEGEGEGETEGRAGRKSGQDEDTDGR